MVAAETKAGAAPVGADTDGRRFSLWKQIIEPVKPFLEQVAVQMAEQVHAFHPEIVPYTRYALTNQGKQLRPVLVALSAGAAGNVSDSLVQVAVIIEMVHLATLVHDDVMDEAVIRRRRPTLAANWGNQISVLVGDCLFAHALRLAASFPSPDICRAVASATNTVCSGEILQTHQRRNFEFTRTQYFKVLEMKTAELFALSCELGASMGGASRVCGLALRKYGLCLGTAYQVYDDCLDLFGSEAEVGKSLGTDLASGKLTLPVLVVLEQAMGEDRARMREFVEHWEPNLLPNVLELLEKYEAQQASRSIIHRYLDLARQTVRALSDSPSRTALVALADFLGQQTDTLGTPA
ncbi:MAG: polyprenyl synthetase family protein [Verrucomicrobia bacterium]|nr:polyprenyl synthetase family protein [Verrucomicrobiota bacterium]